MLKSKTAQFQTPTPSERARPAGSLTDRRDGTHPGLLEDSSRLVGGDGLHSNCKYFMGQKKTASLTHGQLEGLACHPPGCEQNEAVGRETGSFSAKCMTTGSCKLSPP